MNTTSKRKLIAPRPGRDEFGRPFARYAKRLVSRNLWSPLNPMQIRRLRRFWPPAPLRIPLPDAADAAMPAMCGMLLDWEESMRWIARGWDCIEEYTHDVWARLCLDEALDDCRSRGIVLPQSYLRRLFQVDRAFRKVTYDSALCCLSESEWNRDRSLAFFLRQQAEFPKRKFWFLYRWQRGTVWRAPFPNVAGMEVTRHEVDIRRIGKSRRWRHAGD